MNEIVILLIGYHLILFSDYIWFPEAKNKAGYSLLALIMFNIGCNSLVMVTTTIQVLCKKIKRKCQQRRASSSKAKKGNLHDQSGETSFENNLSSFYLHDECVGKINAGNSN